MISDAKSAKQIFLEAIEHHSPDQWPAYLDQVTGEDAQLRRRVEILLEAHQAERSLLDNPAIAPAPAATVDQPVAELAGTQIGPYKLLQQIGEGGMGTVYMAEQSHPVQRKVALKVIKAGMDSGQVIARFEAERQALALMDHVNIARVLDAGATEAGRPFFVMELVHGVPITTYCDDNHLTPRERLELFVPICQAIQHAHQKGIIHRDIKPSNVMVTLYDGKPVPKVIDFGVAKATEQKLTERTLFTQYGMMVGTLEYMSPEQAEMSALGVDTRCDIYSLGVLLYELLTGSTPLTHKRMKEAARAEILRMIKEEEPPRPSTRLSDSGEALASISANRHTEPAKLTKLVRGELDWIVMKTLEKDRNRRYETAKDFAADLQRYLDDEQVQACPPSAAYRFRKFARRNKAALTMSALVAAAMVLGVVVLAISNVWVARERDQKAQALSDKEQALQQKSTALARAKEQEVLAKRNAADAREQKGIAEGEAARAKEEEKTARWHLYTARMNLADQAWRERNVGRALQLLEDQRPEPGQDDPRGFEWYYLWRHCYQSHRFTLRGHRASVIAVAYSPDGKTLASASWDSTIKLWDADRGQLRATLRGHGSAVAAIAFDPEGTILASGSTDGTVRLWDVRTGRERACLIHAYKLTSLVFSKDGKMLATGSGASRDPGELKLWDVATAQELVTLENDIGAVLVALSPDGKTLASNFTCGPIKLWDVETRQLQRTEVGRPRFNITSLVFSPDGKMLASSSFDRLVKVWNLEAGQEHVFAGHTQSVTCVAFSSDSQLLAAGSYDGSIKLWDLATGQPRAAYGHADGVRSLAFAPDGKTLASASNDGTVRLWDVACELERPNLDDHKQMIWSVAFSPDGKTLASCSDDQSIKLWEVATGKVRATLRGHTANVLNVVFSPDSQMLASASDDQTVRLWDAVAGQQIGLLTGHTRPTYAVAFSPDGKTLASGSGDLTVKIWDLATQKERTTLKGHKDWIWSVAFSHDGKTLASSGDREDAKQWDLATGQVRKTFTGGRSPVIFSPDGQTLASGAGGRNAILWDLATGRARGAVAGTSAFFDDLGSAPIALSADWKTLAVGGTDGSIPLFDVATGRERATLRGHTDTIRAIAYSPDNSTVGIGCADGTVKLLRTAREADVLAQTHMRDRREQRAVGYTAESRRQKQFGRMEDAEKSRRQAADLYENLAAQNPSIAEYRYQLAWSKFLLAYDLADSKRPNEAETAYRQAADTFEKLIAEDPSDADASATLAEVQDYLGLLLQADQRLTEAEEACRRAIEIRTKLLAEFPTHPGYVRKQASAHGRRASVLKALGRAQEAEFAAGRQQELLQKLDDTFTYHDKTATEITKAIELKPDDWEGWSRRAFLHFRRQQWDQAISDFSKAIDLAPQVHTNWWHRGHSYLALAQWDKAAADFGKVVEQWPDGAEGWYRRAVALAQLNQPDSALADLRQAIAKGFKDVALMKSDPKLEPLRSHEEFKKLLTIFDNEKEKE